MKSVKFSNDELQRIILFSAYILTAEPPLEEGTTKKKPKQFWELNYKKALAGLRDNVLNRRQFYLLMGVRFGYIIAAYTLPAYYKTFGLAIGCECEWSFIHDCLASAHSMHLICR